MSLVASTNNSNPSGKVIDGGGKVIDGGGKVIDGGGKVIDGGGKVIDGGGKVIDGGGKVIYGGGKVIDGKLIDDGGKLIDGGGKLIDGGGKMIGDKMIGGMYVIKRSGDKEKVHFDKITARIRKLCYGLDVGFVDPVEVSQKVCLGVYKGVTTSELDELAAETAAHLSSKHPDYGLLAARIAVSNLHKNTKKCFTDVMHDLYSYIHPKTGQSASLLSEPVYKFMMANKERLNSAVVYDRDFTYDYFGFKTLERSYLLRLKGKVAERPQHMLMRVSCGIHLDDLEAAIETYELLSNKWFTHASPTLFNSGLPKPQMSSCFLLTIPTDSIEGIYDTLKQCALISKFAGGIGLSVHNIRATGLTFGEPTECPMD